MTNSTPLPEPGSPASQTLPPPPPDAMALQPQLQLVSALLIHLLERLEAPSGEASEQIAEVLSRLSALTLSLTRTADAMERIVSSETSLGQLGLQLERMAARQEAQDRQLAAIAHRTAMMVDWLAGGAAPGETAIAPGSGTTASS